MKKIKASILIANFNNAKYIDKCIRSLEIKNLKNIEIIFHDDCSTDNSLEIINKYKHIKLIKNKVRYKEGSYNQILAYERCFKKK